MLKLTTNGENGSFQLNLPTSLNEITPEYLKDVTKSIKIAPNYSLIGICYREEFSTILFASSSKKKNITTAVVPIFIKAGVTTSEFINSINVADKLIISASQIALGYHVNAPFNTLTIDHVLSCAKGDQNIYKDSLKYKVPCYFLEFKLVPNVDIVGVHDADNVELHLTNPFVNKVTEGAS